MFDLELSRSPLKELTMMTINKRFGPGHFASAIMLVITVTAWAAEPAPNDGLKGPPPSPIEVLSRLQKGLTEANAEVVLSVYTANARDDSAWYTYRPYAQLAAATPKIPAILEKVTRKFGEKDFIRAFGDRRQLLLPLIPDDLGQILKNENNLRTLDQGSAGMEITLTRFRTLTPLLSGKESRPDADFHLVSTDGAWKYEPEDEELFAVCLSARALGRTRPAKELKKFYLHNLTTLEELRQRFAARCDALVHFISALEKSVDQAEALGDFIAAFDKLQQQHLAPWERDLIPTPPATGGAETPRALLLAMDEACRKNQAGRLVSLYLPASTSKMTIYEAYAGSVVAGYDFYANFKKLSAKFGLEKTAEAMGMGAMVLTLVPPDYKAMADRIHISSGTATVACVQYRMADWGAASKNPYAESQQDFDREAREPDHAQIGSESDHAHVYQLGGRWYYDPAAEEPFSREYRLFSNAEERQQRIHEFISNVHDTIEGFKLVKQALKDANTIEELQEKLGVEAPEEEEKGPEDILREAVFQGNLALVKQLVAKGARIEGDAGGKVLNEAALSGVWHPEVLQYLLSNGAAVNTPDNFGHTPLYYAVTAPTGSALPGKLTEYLSFAELLVDHGGNFATNPPIHFGAKVLRTAGQLGNVKMIRFLWENGVKDDEQAYHEPTALHAAVLNGHLPAAETLIELGADVNAVRPVATWAQATMRQPLAYHGANPYRPIDCAADRGNVAMVELLVRKGADCGRSRDGYQPLCIAASLGHVAVAKVLLDHGLDANGESKSSITPLYEAAGSGKKEMVQLLLERGADATKRCEFGTPLSVALERGHKEIAEILRSHQTGKVAR